MALVLSLLTVPATFCFVVPGLITWIVGLIFGIVGKKKADTVDRSNGPAKAAVVISLIELIIGALILVAVGIYLILKISMGG
ncbi:MAG: hypothetical protein J6M12_06815 [Clostridia bacterium]|nr:hypothetical protein [Clostridia bacterium]